MLSRGTPIYTTGTVGATDRVEVAASDHTNPAKMPAIGLLEQDLANNEDGDAVIVGELKMANTNSYSLNQELFVGVGAMTGSRPTTGQVQSIGTVARVQTNTGVIVVNMQEQRPPQEAFAAAIHAATHHFGGSDAIAPESIRAQTILLGAIRSFNTSGETITLNAGRGRLFTVSAGSGFVPTLTNLTIILPNSTDGALSGDLLGITTSSTNFATTTISIKSGNTPGSEIEIATIARGQSLLFNRAGAIWTAIGANLPSDQLPSALGAVSSGVALDYSRSDHVHGMPSAADVGAAPTFHTHTASEISNSTSAGRTLLTSDLANQRSHLDLFPSYANRAAFPAIGEANRVYLSEDTSRIYAWVISTYLEIAPPRCEFICACSDETTLLTAGVAKITFRAPYAFTLTDVRASVNTAPTGSTLIVDINENGTSVLSTKLSIDASEKTSTTAATAAVISDSDIANDAEITIDIDQVGSTIAGKGLKVVLIGTRA